MPAISSIALPPAAAPSLYSQVTPIAPMAPVGTSTRVDSTRTASFDDDLHVVSAMPSGGTPAAWRAADASGARVAPQSHAARVPRSNFQPGIRGIKHLIDELNAANERGDGPLSNKALYERLIEQTRGDRYTSVPALFSLCAPSVLLAERGFELGTMDALYYNFGWLQKNRHAGLSTQHFVDEGRALIKYVIELNKPDLLFDELSFRTQSTVLLHAKANNVSGLENWRGDPGYACDHDDYTGEACAERLIAINAVVADFHNEVKGRPTRVEAQIEARRIAPGYDPFDSALMWVINAVQSIPAFVTAPFNTLRR